jgi:hypothetical protein
MGRIECLKSWLWKYKKCVFILSLILAVVISVIIWLVTTDYRLTAMGILILVLPNLIPIIQWVKGVVKIMKLGWREAELIQKEQEERMQNLLSLYDRQRSNVKLFLKTYVESISYKDLISASCIIIKVSFVNLQVLPCKVIGCKLYVERTDLCEINCHTKPYRINSQDVEIYGDSIEVEATSIRGIDLRISIPTEVVRPIKECADNSKHVQYSIRLKWKLVINGIELSHKDYLSYKEIPNLNLG